MCGLGLNSADLKKGPMTGRVNAVINVYITLRQGISCEVCDTHDGGYSTFLKFVDTYSPHYIALLHSNPLREMCYCIILSND